VTRSLPLFHVDAFTAQAFAGNPAGVCLLERHAEAEWMQLVAREMNLSETAFLVPRGADFDLRWFSPTVEVALCGHATLASAHILWQEGRCPADRPIHFHTASGVLGAERRGDWIELDFPSEPAQAIAAPPGLLEALGVTAQFTGQNRFDYLVEVESEQVVRGLRPDFTALRTLLTRGAIVTAKARAGADYDFVSRFFAGGAGIDEDPATGSSHCCLGPYWQSKLGKAELVGFQASARTGVIRVRVEGVRCKLGGEAVTVTKGEFVVRGA